MTTHIRLLTAAGCLLGFLSPAAIMAQTTENPPTIVQMTVYVFPPGSVYNRNQVLTGSPALNGFILTDDSRPVEGSPVAIRMVVQDFDFVDIDDDEEVFVRKASDWLPFFLGQRLYSSPVGARWSNDSSDGLTLGLEFDTVRAGPFFLAGLPANQRVVIVEDILPFINGNNQARLEERIDFDVRWLVFVDVSNSETPTPRPAFTFWFNVFALNNVANTPNPPPFADAGADQTIVVNSTITLDASQTFDGTNYGFDATDPVILDKDTLIYSWEWLSGPERRDPTSTAATSPTATVLLSTVGTYVYRVTVSDQVNPTPSSDTVTINVVSALPTNLRPIASAVVRSGTGQVLGTSATVTVGSLVQLDGTASTDPDGNPLTFRWRQTNELGGDLTPEEVSDFFQPVAGITTPLATWQPVRPGRYFFRLLVSDGNLSDDERVSIEVRNAVTAGASAQRDSLREASSRTTSPPTTETDEATDSLSSSAAGAAGACGNGVLMLGLAPLGLLMRRRS